MVLYIIKLFCAIPIACGIGMVSCACNLHSRYNLKFTNHAYTPKNKIIPPDNRLTHKSHRAVKRPRNILIPPLKSSHQSAEPRKTPPTITILSMLVTLTPLPGLSFVLIPRPAKMAANERMVCGLVSVSSNVDVYALA